tara:strand:- start:646 stop:1281 length:636 start_codon:yes stop_codon:yes gene_type:complete
VKVIIITGRIATGKSIILRQFKSLGAKTFSSDKMVDDIYINDNDFFLKIAKLFPQVIDKEKINKFKLSNLAFKNNEVLNMLEKIIYPKLMKKIETIIRNCYLKSFDRVVFEVPLLFEKKVNIDFDIVVSTTCNKLLQKQRYLKRNNTDLVKLSLINNRFVEDNIRFKKSSYVINTGNGMHHSLSILKRILRKYERNNFRYRNNGLKHREWP